MLRTGKTKLVVRIVDVSKEALWLPRLREVAALLAPPHLLNIFSRSYAPERNCLPFTKGKQAKELQRPTLPYFHWGSP